MIEVFTIPKSGTKRNSIRVTIPVALVRRYKLKVGGLLGLEDTGDGIKFMPVNKKSAKQLLKNKIKAVTTKVGGSGSGGGTGSGCCPTTSGGKKV